MTETQQPEALRLAECLERDTKMNWPDYDNQVDAAKELRRLHAREQELEQALQVLAGLHPCPTIDGPPMALAELIFNAVLADQRGLKEAIAKQERNLDWMRKELTKHAHGITQEKQG